MPSAEASAIASETAQVNDEANFSARSPLSLFAEPNIGMKHPAMAEAKRISKSESETDDAAIKAEASTLSAKTEPKSIWRTMPSSFEAAVTAIIAPTVFTAPRVFAMLFASPSKYFIA